MPPAPGLFSTTTCGRPATWRSRCWATSRAKMSVGPPAEFGTTRVIVLPLNASPPAAGFGAERAGGEAAGAPELQAARITASRTSPAARNDSLIILHASQGPLRPRAPPRRSSSRPIRAGPSHKDGRYYVRSPAGCQGVVLPDAYPVLLRGGRQVTEGCG